MNTSTMQAVRMIQPGDPDVLRLDQAAVPHVGLDDVLVRVYSSGLNRADLLQRRGRYPVPAGWPDDILGMEFAGEVVEVGRRCRSLKPGDRVMGLLGGGGYAQYVAVHERAVVVIPDSLDGVEAGAVPEVFMTAFDALFLQAALCPGETVLIHAVGSGVGTAAVQLAHAAGVRTLGTSRTKTKLDRALALGLDVAVAPTEGWDERVLEETSGRGVDVILDLVGAPYVPANTAVLSTGARWIVVGVPGGSKAEIDLRGLMRKRASVVGTVLRARPIEEKIDLAQVFQRRVVPQFVSGRLRPVIDRVFSPAEASEAHQHMEADRNFGKILLDWTAS